MAQAIKPTPVLDPKDSKSFLRKISQGLQNPVGRVAPKDLSKLTERIMRDARKQNCDRD